MLHFLRSLCNCNAAHIFLLSANLLHSEDYSLLSPLHCHQDLGKAWNKQRQEGVYLPLVPKQDRLMQYPNPWPSGFVRDFKRFMNNRLVLSKSSKGRWNTSIWTFTNIFVLTRAFANIFPSLFPKQHSTSGLHVLKRRCT